MNLVFAISTHIIFTLSVQTFQFVYLFQLTGPAHLLISPCRMETIFPIQNPHALQDPRVSGYIQYAMKTEKAMFEKATSREAYYQLLAELIYRIRKKLAERKKTRMEMEKQRQPMGEGSSTVG